MKKFASAAVLLACLSLAVAQEKSTKEDKKKPDETPAPVFVKGQLPRGWKALGLTDEQKKKVFTTKAKYAVKRQKLEEQLKALKDEETKELEKVLTDAQKQRLSELKK
ncbi:MAG TPA: hypothetical protein VH643_28980 [Gemmataceae bacterium]